MLKSSDPADLEKLRWMYDGKYRFLDSSTPVSGQKVAYCTFPRSGNSYLRRILESITGVSSGSTVSLHTATTLQIQGLMGEYVTDDRVWIVKAHHPGLIPMNL